MKQSKTDPLNQLSSRERQVLRLVVDGKTSKEIASILGVSPSTVDTYRSRLMAKLDIEDLVGLVRFAIHQGLDQRVGASPKAQRLAQPLNILLVEDVEYDAELTVRQLVREGFDCRTRRVDTEADYRRGLTEFRPDIVLSDFSMPAFDGLTALAIARESDADIPFIFVSGTIGEEVAVDAMRRGANDYVMKTNLTRLGSAVRRELREVEVRRERKRIEAALRESEAGLRRAQLLAGLAHVITVPGGGFEGWSETLPQLVGLDAASMPLSTRDWLAIVHPDDRPLFRAKALEAEAMGTRVDVDYRVRRGDGEWIHVRQVIEPAPLDPHASGGTRWFCTLQDVTPQKRAEMRIRRLNRVYAVLSGISALIMRTNDRAELFREACRIAVTSGGFRLAWLGIVDNDASRVKPVAWHGDGQDYFEAIGLELGESEQQSLVSQVVRERKAVVVDDIANDPRITLQQEALFRGLQSLALLPLIVGERVVGMLALWAPETAVFDDDEMRLLRELAGDISFGLVHIEKTERLDHLAYYDALTGLANRTLFSERLTARLQAGGRGVKLALALMDIDRFRTVSDSLGRAAGDELLKAVAARCLDTVGDAELIGRLVADQFAILMPEAQVEDNVARIVEKMNGEIFGSSYRVIDREIRISAKYGIAIFPTDGEDADSLLREAEEAVKRAKASGDRYLFYAQDMTERVIEQLALENQLRQALERDEFVLHYQAKVDVSTRRIVGVEALLRWHSPELGLVPPLRFISLLEETGMIVDVGAWALRRALLDHRRWTGQGLAPPRVAVNVSAVQLRRRDFVETIRDAIRNGPDAPIIDIEITESVLLENVESTVETLAAIRDIGLNIAIDDFGTGYSSLGYLAKLPVHSLKIDRSFISAMIDDPDTMILVETIISLAHSLRLKVVAEGVETERQVEVLRQLRCDEMQGYLINRPMSESDFVAVLLAAQD